MEYFAETYSGVLMMLLWMGGIFGLLAVLVKRGGIFAAVHRTRKEFLTNVGLVVVNSIMLGPLFVVPEGAIAARVGSPEIFRDFWQMMGDPVSLLAAIVIYDFTVYWRHRAEHHPLLWPIHATHHADTAIHWLSIQRKHPLSKLLSILIDVWLLMLIGLPEWAIAASALLRSVWGYFIHCDLPWTLGIAGKWLISPAAHRLHHIRDEELMGTNFGNTITLWDRLFGTYCDPTPYLNCETGIAEGSRGLLGELVRPFDRRYWRRDGGDAVEPALAPTPPQA